MEKIIKFIVDGVITLESLFVKRETHPGEKRVLILRKDGLGDCLIFYPTLRSYREFYKEARVTLVFPSIFKALGPLLSDADEVIWFDHASFRTSFGYRRKFMLDLKRRGYDIALYPVYSKEPIADKMLKMTGAKEIVTFDEVKTAALSELDRDADFAEYVTGMKPATSFPSIDTARIPDNNFSKIFETFDLAHKKYVIVFPGASFALYRRWPSERFAEIIEMLLKHNITPVLCGSPKEKDLVRSIIEKLIPASKEKIIDLSGMTDFADMAHLLQKSEFYFGSDTGILHLAVAVGTPAIGIIGIGGYRRFFPYGDPSKNRALFDPESMKDESKIGTWNGTEKLPAGTAHPSIENISVEQARREVDNMLEFLYRKKYEKSN